MNSTEKRFAIILPCILTLAFYMAHRFGLSEADGQQVVTVVTTQPGTVTVTLPAPVVTFTPATQPTPPVIVPPVVTPPVVTPPVTPPTVNPSAIVYPTSPGVAQNETDIWFNSLPKDSRLFIDPDQVMTAANTLFISTAKTPGHQATDYSSLDAAQNAAVVGGQYIPAIRRGDPFLDKATIDNNLYRFNGTAAKNFWIVSVGPSGKYHDYTYPRPVIHVGFGIAGSPNGAHLWGGPLHYVLIEGFDFYYDKGDPASPTYAGAGANAKANITAINLIDTGWGSSTDHICLTDCRIRFFTKGVDIESQQAYPLKNLILYRNVIAHNYGWRFGGYDYHTQDTLIAENIIDHNGWDEKAWAKSGKNDAGFPLGMIHNWYTSLNPPTETNDPQHRYLYNVVARAAADGIQANSGGDVYKNYFISNPRDGYSGGGYVAQIVGNVCEGGGSEFDEGAPSSALSLDITNIAGTARGTGLFSDCAKPTALIQGNLFINNPDKINSGTALGVHTQDQPKVMTPFATNATVSGNTIFGWNVWTSDGKANGPNILGLTIPPTPTLTFLNNNFPGVQGIAGVNGNPVNFVDPSRDMDTYAESLHMPGVNNAMDLLDAMDANWSGNWDSRLTAAALETYVALGWVPIGVGQ